MSEVNLKSEDLWTPYKELYRVINYFLCENVEHDNTNEFENILRTHKQNFYALLQNPPKSPKSREELKKGLEEGITIKEIGHQVLNRELFDEAIILSDMYGLNEFVALDLLCTAQIQMPYYHGLPRGLVAVLLYYEGRKFLVMSLRLLIQARQGVSWTMNIKPELANFITVYTNQLLENGIFNKIFDLLKTLDLSKEIEKLQENVALGGPRHRKQVTDLFNNVRTTLAEIVFLWSAQTGLPKEPTVNLINFLRQLNVEEDCMGKMDNVSFFLLAALLSAMDLSVIHSRDDGEEIVQNLPILADKSFIQTLYSELSPGKPKWVNEGMQGVTIFALAITSACLRLVPNSSEFQLAIDKEVPLLCTAIEMKVFEFLNHKVLTNDVLYSDEILMKRFHYLFTDFIVQMFPKVKELRIKADETARMIQVYVNEGLEPPPNLPRYFEYFMLAIAKFYGRDPLNLQYCLEFWCPVDITLHESYSYRAPPRSVSLFKFIRLAGDLVPTNLFVPFLSMLNSLSNCPQAARYCFNMLKQSRTGFNSSVTWDHFFMSFNQYYSNLKQEVLAVTDTVYHRGVHHKGITPQEIAGLHAVLKLIQTIAEKDDFSRLALCEHPGWAPLSVLLGLVSCVVPLPLKADLLLTLAALSKSPETASQMWNNLEASQILVTIPTTSSYQPRGIQTELEEIESRNEEYPLTRSFLVLLDILTDYGIPRMLGAGPRKPGFDPYLTFIINSVFLKFTSRSYKNSEERWIICSLCLKLLEKFLNQYEPQVSDFPSNNRSNEFNSPPGFHVMVQLNLKSEFLNLLLFIIEEGGKLFQQFVTFSSQKYLEECTLRSLNILECALNLQATFFNLLSSSESSLILTNLSKLLLMINPRTGQPDHCLSISKYIYYQGTIPKHSLVAVKIILHVTSSPSLHSQYLNILLSNDKDGDLIRSGFVEALDALQSDKSNANIVNVTKEAILRLLKQCLPYSTPNLSHFLFGFDIKHDISQTLFQHPGVLEFPRTCLHSIFTILKQGYVKQVFAPSSSLLESAYNMLYLLCANYRTSEPVLRFIRQHQSFFTRHMHFCAKNVNMGIAHLNQLSWLMKTMAIELKISCNKNQIFYLQQLTKLLVNMPELDKTIPTDTFTIIQQKSDVSRTEEGFMEVSKTEKLLVTLIENFDFNVEEVATPRWDYFDANVLEGLLKDCEIDDGLKLIDVKKLHHTLVDEISTLQANTAVGQRQAVLQEIQKVLLHALNINNVRNTTAAIIRFVDSWRQVTEVIASYMPFQVLSPTEQQSLSICLMECVCSRVTHTAVIPEVNHRLSGTVLLLMENVRQCQMKRTKSEDAGSVTQAYAEPFKGILHKILTWLLSFESTSQNLRINLYAALVTFLKVIKIEESIKDPPESNCSFYVNRLDSSRIHFNSEKDESLYVPTNIFASFGEKLIDVICQDSIGGHSIGKMLAMSTFSTLISMIGNNNWIIYMGGRGYLKHMIDSILNSDNELKTMLEPTPPNFKPLYMYTSKLSLLTQIASTRVGAELLLEQQMLSCLSTMNVYSLHPEILKQNQILPKELQDFIPNIQKRYLQIFLATLRFCNAIITTLSVENRSAVSQVMYFITSNLDVVEYVLRSGNPLLSNDFLKELSCLTSIIAETASADMTFMMQSTDSIQEYRVYLYRIQKHVLGLLPKFLLTDEVVKSLTFNPQRGADDETAKVEDRSRLLYNLQIIANIVTYSRNIIENNTVDHTSICVIFQPQLGDNFNVGLVSGKSNSSIYTNSSNSQSPPIGVIVQHLIYIVKYHKEEKESLNRKMLKEESDYCIFIIENCLYLLWAHVDYFMLKAIPRIKYDGEVSQLNSSFSLQETLISASEATWKVSTDDISNLKHGLVSILTDCFNKQLSEVVQDSGDTTKQFVETLVRKIKRLLQFVPVK